MKIVENCHVSPHNHIFSPAWRIVHLWLVEHILDCKIEDCQIKNAALSMLFLSLYFILRRKKPLNYILKHNGMVLKNETDFKKT